MGAGPERLGPSARRPIAGLASVVPQPISLETGDAFPVPSSTLTRFLDTDGNSIDTWDNFGPNTLFGALVLQPGVGATDYLLQYGNFSSELTALDGGGFTTSSNGNSTDARYARTAAGAIDRTECYMVHNADNEVRHYAYVTDDYTITDAFTSSVFVSAASGNMVSFLPLTDTTGVLVTDGAPGELWFIDLSGPTATKIGDVGDAPRAVDCDAQMCVVTNFDDGTFSLFGPVSNGATMAPISTIAAGAGAVTARIVPTVSGNHAVASTGFGDDSLWLTVLNGSGAVIANLTVAGADIAGSGFSVDGPGHAELIVESGELSAGGKFIASGNLSNNVVFVPVQAFFEGTAFDAATLLGSAP